MCRTPIKSFLFSDLRQRQFVFSVVLDFKDVLELIHCDICGLEYIFCSLSFAVFLTSVRF